ncbi:MAG: hypothetical protein V4675_25035 [Verrucomicrobiota bacterium]
MTPRPRRWGRRLVLGLGAAALLAAGLGTTVWLGRVSLLNRWLADGHGVWRVNVTGLELKGSQIEVTGLRVSHVDQAEPVFSAERVQVGGDWKAWQRGQLGAVRVESPAVYWRAGLRSGPSTPEAAKGSAPLVTWDSLQIVQGRIDMADPGSYSFTGQLTGEGGPGAWHENGRLALTPQDLTVHDPAYSMTLSGGPVGSVEVHASRLDLQGSLEGGTGTLSITRALLAGSRLKLAGPEGSPRTPLPDETLPESEENLPIVSGIRLTGLQAPQLEVAALLPWAATGKTDLTLGRLQAGEGVAFGMEGLRLDQASARLPHGAQLPQLTIAASLNAGIPRLDLLTFSGADIPDAAGLARVLGLEVPENPAISFKAGGQFRDLMFSGSQPSSAAEQTLTLDDLKLDLPGQGHASATRLTLTAIPDEITTARRLRLVELKAPQAEFLLTSIQQGLTGSPAPASGTTPTSPSRPAWEGWTADRLTVTQGTVSATLPQAGGSKVTTALTVSTVAPQDTDLSPHYQIVLTQPQLAHPDLPDQPIALAGAIQLTASAAGLWQKREIDSLTLAGSRIQIGEALFRLVNALPPPPPAPPVTSAVTPPPSQKSPPWRLRSVVLDDTLIQLDHLGDGRRLDIPVKRQEFQDLPLDSTALAAVDRLYKIEVPNITLYNPFSAGQKVAVLDTNYIQFTPSGLMQRRLERVDLMLPSLYAGQPLFDFVDATRKRFAGLAALPPPRPQPMLVDAGPDSATVLSAIASVTPSTSTKAAVWHIPFFTESGKVFVAPKGFPWPNLPVIPFRNARDASGQPLPFLLKGESFHGELAIEPGWYDFPEYKVRLRLSDRGRIVFNTPQRDHDNNLTEVFENNTLIFRQLQIDDAWLSITYDARGIYARFGGHTCGGTLNGGFNLYLDELYTWDAWASLGNIGMQPLTDKLTPDTFRMSGPVDELTLKAYGDTTTLYQASLDLKVTRPGLLHILALDSMKEKINALGGLSADLGKISLGTLRDFAYTGCTGNLKLFGTEGDGQLCLTGPGGSRTFNLRLHDYRAKSPKSMAPF